jgi:peptidoglycan/LPS O-acetylase OafA/YrhL
MSASPAPRSRFPLIDLLKALAAQLIVWHHLAYYGPMSDVALPLAPDLIGWLYSDGRYAVQIFLVIGGFLAAKNLTRRITFSAWAVQVWKRFFRLASPLPFVVLIAVAANALAAQMMTHDSLSPPPTLLQLATHLVLAHKLAGFDSLSAGLWYPAIDLQLFALFSVLAVVAQGHATGLIVLIATLTALSSVLINRWPAWDMLGLYFAGAYGLGVLAALSAGRLTPAWLASCAIAVLALCIDFRERLLIALLIALLLWAALRFPALMAQGRWRAVTWLADRSYALFLIHFPVLLLVNAAFYALSADPLHHALGMVIGWLLSIVASAIFYRAIEQPLMRRLS